MKISAIFDGEDRGYKVSKMPICISNNFYSVDLSPEKKLTLEILKLAIGNVVDYVVWDLRDEKVIKDFEWFLNNEYYTFSSNFCLNALDIRVSKKELFRKMLIMRTFRRRAIDRQDLLSS